MGIPLRTTEGQIHQTLKSDFAEWGWTAEVLQRNCTVKMVKLIESNFKAEFPVLSPFFTLFVWAVECVIVQGNLTLLHVFIASNV